MTQYPLLSRPALPLDETYEEEVLAIIDNVGKERGPVAQGDETGMVTQGDVELGMAVAKNKAVDGGMGGEIALGKDNQGFLVLTPKGRNWLQGLVLHHAVLGPREAQLDRPAGMNGGEEHLQHSVVQHAPQKTVLEIAAHIALVAMGQKENFVVQLYGVGMTVNNHTTLLLEIIATPGVVVAGEEMHLYASVGELGYFTQETGEALGNDQFELVPVIEHIAQQINGGSTLFDTVEEIHQPALLGARVLQGTTAKVSIGQEIYVLHGVIMG